MFLKSLLSKSYLKEGDPEDSEILILPKGIKAGIDCNMVISIADFEELMVDYRSAEPASEGILMTIGTTKNPTDPIWNVLVMNDAVTERYVELSNQMYAAKNEASEEAVGTINTPPMDNTTMDAALRYGTYTHTNSAFVPPTVPEGDDEEGASVNTEGMKVVHDGGAFVNATEGTKLDAPAIIPPEEAEETDSIPAETQFDNLLPVAPTEPAPESEPPQEPQESSLGGESFQTEPVVIPVPVAPEEYHDPLASFNATLTDENGGSDDTTKEPSASFTPPASVEGDNPFARLDFDMAHNPSVGDPESKPETEPETEQEQESAEGNISSLAALLSQTDEEHGDNRDVTTPPEAEGQGESVLEPVLSSEEPAPEFTPPVVKDGQEQGNPDGEDAYTPAPVFRAEPEVVTTPVELPVENPPTSEGMSSSEPEDGPNPVNESEGTTAIVNAAVQKIYTILNDFQEMSNQYGIINICAASGMTFGDVLDTIVNRGCPDLVPHIESCAGDENILASNIDTFVQVIRETAVDYATRNELYAVNILLYPIIKLIYEEG